MTNKIEYAKKIAIPKMQGQAKLYCFTQTQLENILAEPKLSQSDSELVIAIKKAYLKSFDVDGLNIANGWNEVILPVIKETIAKKNTEIEEAVKTTVEEILLFIPKVEWSDCSSVDTTDPRSITVGINNLHDVLTAKIKTHFKDYLTDSK